MKFLKISSILALAILMNACAESGNDNLCSQEQINDYNEVVFACINLLSDDDELFCKEKTQMFIDHHQGINCKAVNKNDGSIMNITTEIFEKIQNL